MSMYCENCGINTPQQVRYAEHPECDAISFTYFRCEECGCVTELDERVRRVLDKWKEVSYKAMDRLDALYALTAEEGRGMTSLEEDEQQRLCEIHEYAKLRSRQQRPDRRRGCEIEMPF